MRKPLALIECRFCGAELTSDYVVMQHANHAHTVNACNKCAKNAAKRGYHIVEKRGKR